MAPGHFFFFINPSVPFSKIHWVQSYVFPRPSSPQNIVDRFSLTLQYRFRHVSFVFLDRNHSYVSFFFRTNQLANAKCPVLVKTSAIHALCLEDERTCLLISISNSHTIMLRRMSKADVQLFHGLTRHYQVPNTSSNSTLKGSMSVLVSIAFRSHINANWYVACLSVPARSQTGGEYFTCSGKELLYHYKSLCSRSSVGSPQHCTPLDHKSRGMAKHVFCPDTKTKIAERMLRLQRLKAASTHPVARSASVPKFRIPVTVCVLRPKVHMDFAMSSSSPPPKNKWKSAMSAPSQSCERCTTWPLFYKDAIKPHMPALLPSNGGDNACSKRTVPIMHDSLPRLSRLEPGPNGWTTNKCLLAEPTEV